MVVRLHGEVRRHEGEGGTRSAQGEGQEGQGGGDREVLQVQTRRDVPTQDLG